MYVEKVYIGCMYVWVCFQCRSTESALKIEL